MTFLPIVQRELRASSRRKATFRMRSWTALIAMLVTFAFLIGAFFGGSRTGGALLLQILSAYTAFLLVSAALFLTADCISEEKREGTIGLLFLTDLHSYDFILGKFIARSLNAFYGLLALLPIMAIALLFGGLTGAEFWRIALALVNCLFVSLGVGMAISSASREARAATAASFAVLLCLFGVLPAVLGLGSVIKLPSWLLGLCSVSPSLPFYYAYESDYLAAPGAYWRALLGSHVLGWAFIVFASWLVTRTWQYKEISSGPTGLPSSSRGVIRRGSRRRLLEQNPVAWLIGKERGAQWLVWIIVIVWSSAVTIATCVLNSAPPWLYQGTKIAGFLLKLLIASQACRFFTESRGNGMLELLLSTPLRSIEILRGQWLALQRTFLWPLLVFVLFHFVPVALAVYRSFSDAGWNSGIAQILSTILSFGALAGFGLYFLADVYAICWFGAWLALTSKKPALAPLWTILFVVIIPSPLCFLCIIADLFFILWGVIKLHQDFRWLLSNEYQAPAARVAPPLPALSPVITHLASRPR
jgi:ABC-type transport system involved in multi-copper enzyme maturation permease subunit